jgi:AbrB family looped-hinge helix DNA binding protein
MNILPVRRKVIMEAISTTKMSSKGQVVIPEALRKTYGWDAGTSFVVLGRGNAIILQPVTMPDMSQFDDLVAKSRRAARKTGLTEKDIKGAVQSVRADKRASRSRGH